MGKLLRIDPLARRLALDTPTQRIESLVEADDAEARVQALDPYAFYSLVVGAGPTDAAPLLRLASPEQAQSLLDFGAWERDEVDRTRLDAWLAEIVQTPPEDAERLLGGLDTEVLGLFFLHHVRGIYLYADEEDAETLEQVEGRIESSPDGAYGLVMPEDGEASELVRLLLLRLYSRDADSARRLLHAARWELQAQLAETAYQMRVARIAQFGFLPSDEALGLLGRADAPAARAQAQSLLGAAEEPAIPVDAEGAVDFEPRVAQQLLRLTGEGGSFFGRALRMASDRGLEVADRLLLQLRTLSRGLLMAERRDPGRLDEAARAFARAHSGLNIGLEYLTRGELEPAARLLLLWPLKKVFGVGFNLVMALSRQVKRLAERGQLSLVDELPASLAREAEADLAAGLLKWPPVASALDDRDFADLAEVERTAGALALLAYKGLWTFGFQAATKDSLAALATAGGAAELDEITFDAVLATRAALEVVEPGAPLRLLSGPELRGVVKGNIRGVALSEHLADALASVARPPQDQTAAVSGRLVDRWVADVSAALVEGYGGVDTEALDHPELLPKLLLVERTA